jgi:hypothetical protein
MFNELVSLPIIVSDYDAIAESRRSSLSGLTGTQNEGEDKSIASRSTASRQKWSTGFSDFADEIWHRMSDSMKQKLRDACFEVLKRTDGQGDNQSMRWEYDDDARLLD